MQNQSSEVKEGVFSEHVVGKFDILGKETFLKSIIKTAC